MKEMNKSYRDYVFLNIVQGFDLPDNITSITDSFRVYAIDRDGNRSRGKTLYSLDGIIVENRP